MVALIFAMRWYAMEMLLVHYGFLLLLLLLFTRVECAVSFLFSACAPSLWMRFTFKTIILIVSSILLRWNEADHIRLFLSANLIINVGQSLNQGDEILRKCVCLCFKTVFIIINHGSSISYAPRLWDPTAARKRAAPPPPTPKYSYIFQLRIWCHKFFGNNTARYIVSLKQ